MEEESREERIERYYQESAHELAEKLVDAEDEIENVWKPRVAHLEHRLAVVTMLPESPLPTWQERRKERYGA